MGKVQIWVSRAIVLGALGFVAWLGLPAQPSPDPWPSAPDTEALLKPQLLADVGQAWDRQEYQRAWASAELIEKLFPHSPEAARLKPVAPRLERLATQERLAAKWHYKTLSSPGWGTLNEAQIASEPSRFEPEAPASFLLLRTGDLARYRAVFLVPGQALPADSYSSCRLRLASRAPTREIQCPMAACGRPGRMVASKQPGADLGVVEPKNPARGHLAWPKRAHPL